ASSTRSPAVAESYVSMMFNMPGMALVVPAGKTNPDFVHDAFNDYVNGTGNLPADGLLRSWHVSYILEEIVARVRDTDDP
ncbi:MAG: hypothetical protein ACREQV_20745, partial [Candidatus Binatia bacterium]